MFNIIFYILILVFATIIGFYISRYFLSHLFRKILHFIFKKNYADINFDSLIQHLNFFIPLCTIFIGLRFIPDNAITPLFSFIQALTSCLSFLLTAIIASDILNIVGYIYQKQLHTKPIKGYLQILKIIAYTLATLLIFATLLNQPPLLILSGLGAMAAIVILIFQDTILSLVAGIQISSTDLIHVNDWIEIPNLNVDGIVTDIALHTVSVRNWDNTIANVPIRKLVTDSFRNWRGMQQSGGRRIKRSLYIDQETIRFLSDKERQSLNAFRLLKKYLEEKEDEIKNWNEHLGPDAHVPENTRRLTNLGTLRAYMISFLRSHPHIRQDMTLLVRLLPPTPQGIPLEIYCFCTKTGFFDFESVQADIFDHLYSIIPAFGLRIFQEPSGHNIHLRFNGAEITKK